MRVLCISGSPRVDGNTAYLLNTLLSTVPGQFVRLTDCRIEHCKACWGWRDHGHCVITDDMTETVPPLLLESDAVILGSPVFFNNVTADMKGFMDRTWCVRGKLRNKIGGAVVVGRRCGLEAAVTAINGFFLKHDMIVANRGVAGIAFEKGEVSEHAEAIAAIKTLAERITDLKSGVA